MLVLNRNIGESVIIRNENTNEDLCTIKVLAASNPNSSLRLGFQASPNISIVRDNAVKKIK